MRGIGNKYLSGAAERRGFLRDTAAARSGDEDVDGAAKRFGRRQRLCRSPAQGRIIMLRNKKDGHYCKTPVSRSFSTSSGTDLTLLPAFLAGGSAVFSTLSLGSMLMPSEAASISSSCFFFAFMIFGSDA